ncbi:MAG: hypothetical protein ACI9MC_002990 [Kiritimatiellia bacterium]|jgi:hypothetical protein
MRAIVWIAFALSACSVASQQPSAAQPTIEAKAVSDLANAATSPRLRVDSEHPGLVLGGLQRAQIQHALSGHMDQAVHCLDGRTGTVDVRLVVKADGSVKMSRVKQHNIGDDAAASCAADALAASSFPPPAGGGLTIVTWPVRSP